MSRAGDITLRVRVLTRHGAAQSAADGSFISGAP